MKREPHPRGASPAPRVAAERTSVAVLSLKEVMTRVVTALASPASATLSQSKPSHTSQDSAKNLLPSERMGIKKMQYEEKDGEGAAFYSASKRNERQPDWTGKFKWNGQEFELAMWERKAKKDNRPYLRFVVKEKFVPYSPNNNPPPRQQAQPQPEAATDFDDSIPF